MEPGAAFRLDILLAAIRGCRGNPVYSYFGKYWGSARQNDSSARSSARRACKPPGAPALEGRERERDFCLRRARAAIVWAPVPGADLNDERRLSLRMCRWVWEQSVVEDNCLREGVQLFGG